MTQWPIYFSRITQLTSTYFGFPIGQEEVGTTFVLFTCGPIPWKLYFYLMRFTIFFIYHFLKRKKLKPIQYKILMMLLLVPRICQFNKLSQDRLNMVIVSNTHNSWINTQNVIFNLRIENLPNRHKKSEHTFVKKEIHKLKH